VALAQTRQKQCCPALCPDRLAKGVLQFKACMNGLQRELSMRSVVIQVSVVVVVLALATLGVVQAVRGWPAPPGAAGASSARPAAHASAVPVVRRPPAAIEPVALQQLRALQHARHEPAANDLVLDLERLESLDAAQELALAWREGRAANAALTCWLTAADRASAEAAAAVLARDSCTRVLVAV
jgi:hypothetical protein